MKEVREEWIALQMLSVFAGISAIVGLVVLFAFARASEKALCHGVTVAVSWLLSGMFITFPNIFKTQNEHLDGLTGMWANMGAVSAKR